MIVVGNLVNSGLDCGVTRLARHQYLSSQLRFTVKKPKLYLLFLFLIVGLVCPQVSFAKEKLAVMDLKAKYGISKGLAEALSVEIRDAIHSYGDYEVLSKEDLETLAERTATLQYLGCAEDDSQCLIDFGRKLGTEYMVAGSISKLGDTYSINLRLIDTKGKDAGVKNRANEKCKCSEDELFNTAKSVAALVMGKKKPKIERVAEPAAPEGEAFTNSIGMKFVLIPSGTFMMGSPSNEPKRDSDERQHRVTISKPFYMQTTEVTQGQWREVMGNNPSYFKNCGDDCPVEKVFWNDVQGFIRKLNQKEGTNRYRLPTEAEWEYACRAGTATPFYFGDCLSTDQANYHGNYPMPGCSKGEYRKRTLPAGSFQPNAWGLYDMHGNVYEWCQDWYGEYPSGHATDPAGPSSGTYRVLRGGSWYNAAWFMRSADRYGYAPDFRSGDLGFRVARTF